MRRETTVTHVTKIARNYGVSCDCRFVERLRLRRARHTLITRQASVPSLSSTRHDGGEKLKLAIVEDEVILAMALTLMLEDWGHHVVGTADTEAGALALVAAEKPD